MRILALTNLYPNPLQPGRAPFNRQIFEALARQHSLRVIAPIAWKTCPPQMSPSGLVVDHPRYLYPPKILRNWHGHFFRRSVRESFNRAVREFHPDLIYGSWAYPDGWAAVELGREAGLPVIVKVHGSDIYQLDAYPARKYRTRQALARADAVIAPSKDLAKRVIELGADSHRVHVVYNGVDASLFHPGDKSESRNRLGLPLDLPVVLFVGNLVPVKGIDVLIEACGRLENKVVCHLIGDGPLKSRFMSRAHCLGSRPHDELPDWYRAADVLVLPSQSEGVPNVLLEAMACGTPFVASNVGGIPEVAQLGNGKRVRSGDVEAFARAICETLTERGTPEPTPGSPRSFDDAAAEMTSIFQKL